MRTTDIFQQITEKIIAAVEAGASAYEMPWHRWGTGAARPVNAVTGRPYRGINTLLLWAAAEESGYASGQWATYRQWEELGCQVRRRERSTSILFWKKSPGASSNEHRVTELQTRGPQFISRSYCVFNCAQVDGDTSKFQQQWVERPQRIKAADNFILETGCDVRHGGDHAFYAPDYDQVWMPNPEQFRDMESYYSVLAHECVHWSGAAHRLKRELSSRFGSDAYAMEELIAELGAAFIAGHLGLAVEPRPDHAAYITSWLGVLSNDAKAVIAAAAKAQEAVDYLMSFSAGEAKVGNACVKDAALACVVPSQVKAGAESNRKMVDALGLEPRTR